MESAPQATTGLRAFDWPTGSSEMPLAAFDIEGARGCLGDGRDSRPRATRGPGSSQPPPGTISRHDNHSSPRGHEPPSSGCPALPALKRRPTGASDAEGGTANPSELLETSI